MSALRALVEKHYTQVANKEWDRAAEVFTPDVETTEPGAGTIRWKGRFSGRSRQGEPERRSGARCAFHADPAPVLLHDAGADRKSEAKTRAGAGFSARCLAPVEALPYPPLFLRGEAGSFVPH